MNKSLELIEQYDEIHSNNGQMNEGALEALAKSIAKSISPILFKAISGKSKFIKILLRKSLQIAYDKLGENWFIFSAKLLVKGKAKRVQNNVESLQDISDGSKLIDFFSKFDYKNFNIKKLKDNYVAVDNHQHAFVVYGDHRFLNFGSLYELGFGGSPPRQHDNGDKPKSGVFGFLKRKFRRNK